MKINKCSKTPMKRSYDRSPDKMSIDFCRCLYQAKAIVKELQSFGDSVCPALNIYPEFIKCKNLDGPLVLRQVNKYLDTTFQKFNRLCQILLMVLSKMESKSTKDRINSFRSEVWNEWHTATFIKQRLLHSIHSNTSPSETAPNHHILITHSSNTTTATMTTSTILASTSTTTKTTTTKTCKFFQYTSA